MCGRALLWLECSFSSRPLGLSLYIRFLLSRCERRLAVEAHDFKGHLGGGVHVFNVEPLFDGVYGAHPRAEVRAFDSALVEDVRVSAAARRQGLNVEPHARGG